MKFKKIEIVSYAKFTYNKDNKKRIVQKEEWEYEEISENFRRCSGYDCGNVHDRFGGTVEAGFGRMVVAGGRWFLCQKYLAVLDGNQDGVYESYYFDDSGYLAVNTVVDGYQVNGDGCWVDSGRVMTRQTGQAARNLLEKVLNDNVNQSDMDAGLTMNMEMAMEGLTMNIGMAGDMKVKNATSEDMQYLMNLNLNLLGQQMNMTSFYADGYTYMDVAGQKMKVPTDYASALETSQTAQMMYADNMSYMQDVTAADNVRGTRSIYYTMDGTQLNDLVLQILASTDAAAPSTMNMSLGTCKGELTQDSSGNVIQQRMLMDMSMTAEGTPVNYEIFMELNMNNPGQPVDFALPSMEGYEEVPLQ